MGLRRFFVYYSMTTAHPPQLWQQLQQVAGVLLAIQRGQSGTVAIGAVPAPLRPGVQALSFEVLRSLGQAQALRKLLAPRTPPPAVDALLSVALALLCRQDGSRYEPFTLVNQAVEASKKTPSTKPQAAFVNACLRRFLREQDALAAKVRDDPVARWNHPAWWIDQIRSDWPNHWQTLLRAADQPGPMVLRINARRTTQDTYLKRLQEIGMEAWAVGRWGIILKAPCGVQDLPGFANGDVSVQDSAAQLSAPLLLSGTSSQQLLRVLDACAAPGGKTAHLLELADVALTALDVDAVRCERIHQNLNRLGLSANVIAADAADVSAWWDGNPFDAILLDAPCSGSGIVRRHPDIRWLRRQTDLGQLVETQARLLSNLWPLLTPGGRLLYCTCSVFKAEGEQQITRFLSAHASAVMLPNPGHLLPTDNEKSASAMDNQVNDHDGFYYALLEKRAA